MLKTTERVITVSDLHANLDTALYNAKQEPLLVTANGRPSVYLFSVEMFDSLMERVQMLEESELIAGINLGERQFERGQFVTLQAAAERAEAKWMQTEAA